MIDVLKFNWEYLNVSANCYSNLLYGFSGLLRWNY